jgi:ParB family chromosome partitioning protein
MVKTAGALALAGFEDIFNVGTPQNGERVTEVALTELHAPDCHPFQVNDDEAMTRLVESVKQFGVREPGLARPHPKSTV